MTLHSGAKIRDVRGAKGLDETQTGLTPTTTRGPLLVDPDLAWSTTFYVGLPIWLCACMALGATPVVRIVGPLRVTLTGAAAVTGAALAQMHTAPDGLGWFGAPDYLGPFAVAVLLFAAVTTAVLAAVGPRVAPAAVIAAGPWLLPASVQLIGPGPLAVFVWIAAWLAVATVSAVTWRRGSASSPQPA